MQRFKYLSIFIDVKYDSPKMIALSLAVSQPVYVAKCISNTTQHEWLFLNRIEMCGQTGDRLC